MSKRPELEFGNCGEPTAESLSRINSYDTEKIAQLTAENERLRGVVNSCYKVLSGSFRDVYMGGRMKKAEIVLGVERHERLMSDIRQVLTTTTESKGDDDEH